MRRDPTSYSASQPNTPNPDALAPQAIGSRAVQLRFLLRLLAVMSVGALLLTLAYQIPVAHTVDVGGYDSAYVQGFYDPERALPGQARPELAGSDGSARWTRGQSFLLFPQAGLPAQVTLRLRGWRPAGASPNVAVLLNGTRELGRFQATPDWHGYSFMIDGGLLKPNDVVIEIRSDTAQLDADDPRAVGVLLDRAIYQAGPPPMVPYPPQLLYGALAAGMLYILMRRLTTDRRSEDRGLRIEDSISSRVPSLSSIFNPLLSAFRGQWVLAVSLVALSAAFLLLYRAQLPYPYPLLRLLPAVDGMLAALLALRYGPALARRIPALYDALAVGGIGAWLAAVLLAAQRHLVLSVPGAEKDFRVFALRSAHLAGSFPAGAAKADLDGVFRADGFYNLGYPLLLWAARPFAADNPFLAARLVAALGGALLLGAGWWLARRLLGRGPALLALLMLALSPLVVEHALYVGTDMPFAAFCALAIVLLMATEDEGRKTKVSISRVRSFALGPSSSVLAGVAAGAAFLVRHPGLLLLPFGWLVIWTSKHSVLGSDSSKLKTMPLSEAKGQNSKLLLLFTLAFVITIAPQLYVNLRDTGAPLYSQQAKNVWQAVFGNGDWGRWGETNNSIALLQVIAQDPGRFFTNWWNNVRGFLGTGGEDTREFGQAAQLRLLGFPANWLAVAGLLGWLVKEGKRQKAKGKSAEPQRFTFYLLPSTLLLIWIALYVLAISVGLPLQGRFLLPLVPVYALAAAWSIARFTARAAERETIQTPPERRERITHYLLRNSSLLASILLLILLWGGFAIGSDYVLRPQPDPVTPGQPPDALGMAQLTLAAIQPGQRVVVRVAPGDEPGLALGKYSALAHLVVPAPASDDPAALRATRAHYLIWSAALGPAPSVGPRIGAAGMYTLYRIEQ